MTHTGLARRGPGFTRGFGFTLVELLVVVGIIAVLISLLMPTVRRVQYQAKLTECSSKLRQVGAGVMAYANHHHGVYPRRQCNFPGVGYNEAYWLVSEPGPAQRDDRVMLRPYVQDINYLHCPLSPEYFDMNAPHGGRGIVSGYEMWYGSQWDLNDLGTRMFRIGQRPRVGGRKFRILASDIERWAYWYPKINSGHPDFQYLTPLFSIPETNYANDPTAALSQWHNPRGILRGPVDRQFLYDDGSVVRLRLEMNDASVARVPYIPYNPFIADGWLPFD